MTSSLSSTPSSENTGEKDNVHWITEHINLLHYLIGQGYVNVYHCNGVLCLIKDTKTITLCNLALRDFGIFHPETDLESKYYRILGTGFGCDLGDGNYKIVRLLEPMIAEVFTPGTTNSWRQIGTSIDYELCGNLESHVYLKGKCFWLMLGGFQGQSSVSMCLVRCFIPCVCQMKSTSSKNRVLDLPYAAIPFVCFGFLRK